MSAPGVGASGTQRVFVALWPTPASRLRLAEVAAHAAQHVERARPVESANLHLTLAFVGSLRADRLEALAVQLEQCGTGAFDWTLDHLGHFARAHVIWAGGPSNPALLALAREVRELLDRSQVNYDRKPFVPHVTLLRDVAGTLMRRIPLTPPIVWSCGRPTLVRSVSTGAGVSYIRVRA
jgi:2'-5' RNA ligase